MILGTAHLAFRRYALSGIPVLFFLLPAWLGRAGALGLESSLRRSLATAAFLFLCLTLLVGPAGVLWKPALRLLPWRRETGVWFFLLALAHALMALGGSFGWNLLPTLSRGVGLANLMGVAALFLSLLLAATSSDRAVAWLGLSAWKWLHYSVYAIFYLTLGHLYYFLFISSFTAVDRFPAPYLVLAATVPLFQAAASAKFFLVQRARVEKGGKSRKPVRARVRARHEINPGTWSVDFDIRGTGYRFQAGQYAGFRLPSLAHPDPRGPFRLFSIVSRPGSRRTMTIAFRNTGSGYKKTLLEMAPGSEVSISPPAGYLAIPGPPRRNIVLVANGIGVTPFVSMIRHAAARNLPHRILLLCVNRSEESTPFLGEIREIAGGNRNISFRNYLSSDALRKALREVPAPGEKDWYIAGSHSMVTETRQILVERQVPPARIVTEEFFGL